VVVGTDLYTALQEVSQSFETGKPLRGSLGNPLKADAALVYVNIKPMLVLMLQYNTYDRKQLAIYNDILM
jgi:hypothetical protein